MWILFCTGSSASLEVTSGWAALLWGIWVNVPGHFSTYVRSGWTAQYVSLQYFGWMMIGLGTAQLFAAIAVSGRYRKWPALGLLFFWSVIAVEGFFIASYLPSIPVYVSLSLGNLWILSRGATHDRWKGVARAR